MPYSRGMNKIQITKSLKIVLTNKEHTLGGYSEVKFALIYFTQNTVTQHNPSMSVNAIENQRKLNAGK